MVICAHGHKFFYHNIFAFYHFTQGFYSQEKSKIVFYPYSEMVETMILLKTEGQFASDT